MVLLVLQCKERVPIKEPQPCSFGQPLSQPLSTREGFLKGQGIKALAVELIVDLVILCLLPWYIV